MEYRQKSSEKKKETKEEKRKGEEEKRPIEIEKKTKEGRGLFTITCNLRPSPLRTQIPLTARVWGCNINTVAVSEIHSQGPIMASPVGPSAPPPLQVAHVLTQNSIAPCAYHENKHFPIYFSPSFFPMSQ